MKLLNIFNWFKKKELPTPKVFKVIPTNVFKKPEQVIKHQNDYTTQYQPTEYQALNCAMGYAIVEIVMNDSNQCNNADTSNNCSATESSCDSE